MQKHDEKVVKDAGEMTALLARAGESRDAHDRLWVLLERSLRRTARHLVGKRGALLQPTEIVSEAYVQFASRERPGLETELEFKRYAAKVMKRVVAQAARRRSAIKRSGRYERETLTDQPLLGRSPELELLIQDALDRLRAENAGAAEAVELQQYGGLTLDEIARALSVGLTTAKELLSFGKARLKADLAGMGL